jgi:hypothetical protein
VDNVAIMSFNSPHTYKLKSIGGYGCPSAMSLSIQDLGFWITKWWVITLVLDGEAKTLSKAI